MAWRFLQEQLAERVAERVLHWSPQAGAGLSGSASEACG